MIDDPRQVPYIVSAAKENIWETSFRTEESNLRAFSHNTSRTIFYEICGSCKLQHERVWFNCYPICFENFLLNPSTELKLRTLLSRDCVPKEVNYGILITLKQMSSSCSGFTTFWQESEMQ